MDDERTPDTSSEGGPPRSAEEVLARLEARLDALTPQARRAAQVLLEHPREIGVRSMRSMAAASGLHPNTFVRLAKQLGFDGYETLRERFRDFMGSGLGGFSDRALWLQSLAAKDGPSAVFGAMGSATIGNLEQLYQPAALQALDRAVVEIFAARRVFVLGHGAAHPLALSFGYHARMIFDAVHAIPRPGALAMDDLGRAEKGDALLAITVQPYRMDTLRAVEAAVAQSVRVLGVTDSRTSPLVAPADVALIAPTHTPQSFPSMVAIAALLEMLMALLVARGGRATAERLGAFHHARWRDGVYLEER